MKTKETRVPQFDEIIFENRNKTYGAYGLRKRYKSTKSLSVLFAVTLAVSFVTALFLKSDDGIASGGETHGIIVYVDPVKPPDFVEPEVVKPAEELMKNVLRNLKPEITEDTGRVSDYIPTNQEIIDKTPNGNVADGSVDRAEFMRGVDVLLDNEAIRVMGTVPKFRPGKQNGVPVPVWFTIPVVFQLK